jgi:hypothetical protein
VVLLRNSSKFRSLSYTLTESKVSWGVNLPKRIHQEKSTAITF